jgi:hypothetical protein
MNAAVSPAAANPFPGLRPFRAYEEHLFFGRESQVDAMVDKLARTRFLAVVGSSGSGKSSLVSCGLRPALHRGLLARAGTSWRIAQFRPGSSPIRAMAHALAEESVLFSGFEAGALTLEEIIDANLRMSRVGLVDICQQARLGPGENLLVVVDQFEELFRYHTLGPSAAGDGQDRNPEGIAFVNLLLEARSQTACPIYIVLTMRSDFLGDCTEFPGLPDAINEGQYLVPRLTRDERRAAIAGPVGVAGGSISAVLLTRLVNDVGDNPDQLSILQHALNRTWAHWWNEGRGRGRLDLPDYQAIGTMARALDEHAETAYGELAPSQRRVCEKIFKALTDKGTDARGIRRPASLRKLVAVAGASQDEVVEVIDAFRESSRSFLMPPMGEALGAETVIDIAHESLMRIWDRLTVWAGEEAQSAQLYRRLAETAALYHAGKAAPWQDPDLQVALEWREREKPIAAWAELYGGGFQQAMDFLAESEAQRDREVQEKEETQRRELAQAQALAEERQRRVEEQAAAAWRLRRWLAALAVAAFLLVGVVAFAWVQRTTAEEARKRAESQTQLAQGQTKKAEDATGRAQAQTKKAERAENELRLEALRVRGANVNYGIFLTSLMDTLIQNSSPQQALLWRRGKANFLIERGDYDAAERELNSTLEGAPDYLDARNLRGYLSMVRSRPRDALKDFEYIRDHLDDRNSLNYSNLAIAYAELGDSASASGSLDRAIANLRFGTLSSGGVQEDYILPDITVATGRTTIAEEKDGFEAALHYMRANLKAYAGDTPGLQQALKDADQKSQALSSLTREDAYFVAMSWAWLHQRVVCPESGTTCKDYGALVSQAQLWERARYPEWAGCYYRRFQEQHRRWYDPRYGSLAKWAAEAQAKLPPEASSFSCRSEREPDVESLETEAKEAGAGKNYSRALHLLDRAMRKANASEQMHLLLAKARVQFELGQDEGQKGNQQKSRAAFEALIKTCDQILKSDPGGVPTAYLYRAAAHDWLDTSSAAAKELVLKDLDRALQVEPAYTDALSFLNSLIDQYAPASDAKEMRSYLERYQDLLDRYNRISPADSNAFLHQAMQANLQKRYGDALRSIETAIAIEPENLWLYPVREEAERGLNVGESQVKRNLAEGYRQAGDILQRRGSPVKARDAYAKSWLALAGLAKGPETEEILCDTNITTCNVTRTVEGHGEAIYGAIASIADGGGAERQARIDKGSRDGIVVGARANVWSPASKEPDGHERKHMKRGTGEVLSVEPDTALVRITTDSPSGDGMIRAQDSLILMARTPPHPKDSALWALAKLNVTIEDVNNGKIMDYRTLYSEDTPALEERIRQALLRDIHDSGPRYGDTLAQNVLHGQAISQGPFAGKTIRQAFESATLGDLDRSLELAAKTSGIWFGRRWKTASIYLEWVMAGTPSN